MNLVLFTHPEFLGSQSMPRYAATLAQGFARRGHHVTLRAPVARWRRRVPGSFAKWGGYVDQYVMFPRAIQRELARDPADTLYVFCDQALGPWVPCVAHRPHVVHCHDFLALRSALGEFPQNPTRWSGRLYQRYIRRGFAQARHFISISAATRDDLHRYGGVAPVTSEVVYNGLNHPYAPLPAEARAALFNKHKLPGDARGHLLHVGSGVWYKNRDGVVRLYAAYARQTPAPLPLWLVGGEANAALRRALAEVPPQGRVELLHGLDNEAVQAAYASARALLFPSLAEGFGWPIIEAQACGCPVITTGAPPMNEIGGPHTRYLPTLRSGDDVQAWAANGAAVLDQLLQLPDAERETLSRQCIDWARRFGTDTAIDGYLRVYRDVMDWEVEHGTAPIPLEMS